MLRSIVSAASVSALLATAGLVAASSPASAAINRCGSAYSDVSTSKKLDFDDTPSIQRFRVRFIPSTRKMCVEFLKPSPYYRTNGHVIYFRDSKNSPTAMTCAALSCKWKSDDARAYISLRLEAAPINDPADWKSMNGGTIVQFVAP